MSERAPYRVSRADVLWNTAGITASAVSSLLLVLGTTRIAGAQQGGIFSIAFATAQLLMMVGNYGLRTYQVSDIHHEYRQREYQRNRVLTCAAMMILGIGYCLFGGFDAGKTAVVLLVVAAKMIDAYADVFEGHLQQCGHLAVAGRSMAIRMAVTTVAYLAVLALTGDLMTASVAMLLTAIASVALATVLPQRRLCPADAAPPDPRRAFGLLLPAFPLFFSAFGLMLIANTPKYAIDALMTSQDQSIFSILYLPAMAVSLLASFAFKPMITGMAEQWAGGAYRAMRRVVHVLLLYVLAALLLVLPIGYLAGIPVLQLLSGLSLGAYRTDLLLVIIGGAMTAASALLLQALTVMRRQVMVFWAYLAIIAVSVLLSAAFTARAGLLGAAVAYLLQMLLLTVTLYTMFWRCMRAQIAPKA